jgi:hypothetical protein
MDPLSAIGSAAAVLQFVRYAGKTCHFVKTLSENNHDDFYEGIFMDITGHFSNFSNYFKLQQQAGFTSGSSPNQEVGRL